MKKSHRWGKKDRNTPAERARRAKYDAPEHRRARVTFRRLVDAGLARCWRCGRPIPPGEAFHVGHHDIDTDRIMGPEHPACNGRAATLKGVAVARARRRNGITPTSRPTPDVPFVRPVR